MTEDTTAVLNVLVTGATEALGREIVRRLAASGHKPAGMTSSLGGATTIRQDGGLPVYADLFRAGEVASTLRMMEADVIINAATQGINAMPPHQADWDYYQRLLSAGTAALTQAAADAGVKFFVHLSYAFLYGDKQGQAVDEKASLATDAPLLRAAANAERTVLRSGVPACVLRAGYNYGPDSGSLLALRAGLRKGGSLPLGDDANLASWVHSADLAEAVLLAVEKQPAGEILNIADDHPLSPGAFADTFADVYGIQRPGRQRIPGPLAQLMLNPNHQALLQVSAVARADKARDVLGWSAKYADARQGIEQALLAWRAHA